jgi:hypothetical protein
MATAMFAKTNNTKDLMWLTPKSQSYSQNLINGIQKTISTVAKSSEVF